MSKGTQGRRSIYFWEYAPKQALTFAHLRQRQYRKKRNKTAYDQLRATEPLAVIACMIRLGFCLDLTEPENAEYVAAAFASYKAGMEAANAPLPKNIEVTQLRFSDGLRLLASGIWAE